MVGPEVYSMKKPLLSLALLFLLLLPSLALAAGNSTSDSFAQAKKMLGQVYTDHRVTFYCGAEYDAQGNVTLPDGFATPKHEKRADKIEWEHSLPAENFTYFYMQDAYGPRYHMSRQQEQLMQAWDRQYPVDKWECTRAKRIEALQGNENKFVKGPCVAGGLW